MGVIQRVVKPSTQRGKRALKEREPKQIENDKKTLFIHGQNTSQIGRDFFKSIYGFKKNDSTYLGRKNSILPFEDYQKIERLSKKHDASLFGLTTHSKKRPHNVVLGRLYNHQILDMIELSVCNFKGREAFGSLSKISSGTKPCLIFHGVCWHQTPEYARLKSLFMDFFRGPTVKNVSLTGFELCIQFTAHQDTFLMRVYKIILLKSGTEMPRVELEEIGPSANFTLRRSKIASADLLKTACRIAKISLPNKSKHKNLTRDNLGTRFGRIHMKKQDLGELQVRKSAVIKKAKRTNLEKKKQEKSIVNAAIAAAKE